jgi:hypothetical protein
VRKDDLVQQVEQVCLELARAGQDVTFTMIAARTGMGRSTLYRHPELRRFDRGVPPPLPRGSDVDGPGR